MLFNYTDPLFHEIAVSNLMSCLQSLRSSVYQQKTYFRTGKLGHDLQDTSKRRIVSN